MLRCAGTRQWSTPPFNTCGRQRLLTSFDFKRGDDVGDSNVLNGLQGLRERCVRACVTLKRGRL